jgi:hypothetical protein
LVEPFARRIAINCIRPSIPVKQHPRACRSVESKHQAECRPGGRRELGTPLLAELSSPGPKVLDSIKDLVQRRFKVRWAAAQLRKQGAALNRSQKGYSQNDRGRPCAGDPPGRASTGDRRGPPPPIGRIPRRVRHSG